MMMQYLQHNKEEEEAVFVYIYTQQNKVNTDIFTLLLVGILTFTIRMYVVRVHTFIFTATLL